MNWRVTSTTLFCETVKKWVPIMVYGDGRTHCGYFYRHHTVLKNGKGNTVCAGPQSCSLCAAYKEDVLRRDRQQEKEG